MDTIANGVVLKTRRVVLLITHGFDATDFIAVQSNFGNTGPAGIPGDADCSGGFVDALDFIIWNATKFTNNADYCSGDFNADGVVDGSDFNLWNERKFTSS